MSFKERIDKQAKFVEETIIIHNKLLNLHLNWVNKQKLSRELILNEWNKFMNLAEKGKEDGIEDGDLFFIKVREMTEDFKIFEDVEFKIG